MATIREIYNAINKKASFSSQMDFDNSGLLVGSYDIEVKKALVALDITHEVIDEARSLKASLIISHHPVIFNPLKSLTENDPVYLLAKNEIAAMSCHTNLDIHPGIGVNCALADTLLFKNFKGEMPYKDGYELFSGELDEELSCEEFIMFIKSKLNIKHLSYRKGREPIKKVFFCSGAGGGYACSAYELGADAFITGEMKHNEMVDASRLPITSVAVGHYQSEKVFAKKIIEYLKTEIREVDFILSVCERPPFNDE